MYIISYKSSNLDAAPACAELTIRLDDTLLHHPHESRGPAPGSCCGAPACLLRPARDRTVTKLGWRRATAVLGTTVPRIHLHQPRTRRLGAKGPRSLGLRITPGRQARNHTLSLRPRREDPGRGNLPP